MPPIIVNGVTIETVVIDGVEQDIVMVDGVEVFSAAPPPPVVNVVTEGSYLSFGNWNYGMDVSIPYGSANPGVYKGGSFSIATYNVNSGLGNSWSIALTGNHPQGLFVSVTPQGGPALNSSGAVYFPNNFGLGYTSWLWYVNLSGWDGSGTRTVVFNPPE